VLTATIGRSFASAYGGYAEQAQLHGNRYEPEHADRGATAGDIHFGYPGESLRYERDSAGNTQRRIASGITLYPEAIFRQRYATESHWRPDSFA
jgi:hypothetical protein